jgi:hypothetical protein
MIMSLGLGLKGSKDFSPSAAKLAELCCAASTCADYFDINLRIAACVALASCSKVNRIHRNVAVQTALQFLNEVATDNSLFVDKAEAGDSENDLENEIDSDVELSCIAGAAAVAKAMWMCCFEGHQGDEETKVWIADVADKLSKICIHVHSKGKKHFEFESPYVADGRGSLGKTTEGAPILSRTFAPLAQVNDLIAATVEILAKSVPSGDLLISFFKTCFEEAEVLIGDDAEAEALGETVSMHSASARCARIVDLIARSVEYTHMVAGGGSILDKVIKFTFPGFLQLHLRARSCLLMGAVSSQLVALAAVDQLQSTERSTMYDLCVDALTSTYAKAFKLCSSTWDGDENAESKSAMIPSEGSLPLLSGLSNGLYSLVLEVATQADADRLNALRRIFTSVFCDLTLVLLTSSASSGEKTAAYAAESTSSSNGIGLLLRPIAAVYSQLHALGSASTSSAFIGMQPSDLQQQRHLWYAMTTFRLCNENVWSANPSWLRHYQTIATTSPPLLHGVQSTSGPEKFLALELQSDVFLQKMAKLGRVSKFLSNVIRSVACTNVSSMPLPMKIFCVSMQFLESLRAAACLDIRPLVFYLSDSNIAFNTSVSAFIDPMCNHVFSVWKEATAESLRLESEAQYGDCKIAATRTSVKIAGDAAVKGKISQVFEYLMARTVSKGELLQAKCLRFSGLILDRYPWLRWQSSSVRTLLDSVNLLALRQMRLRDGGDYSPVDATDEVYDSSAHMPPTKGDIFSIYSLGSYETDAMQAAKALLSLSELPNSSEGLAVSALGAFELTYSWLSAGLLHMPQRMGVILQEYLLSYNLDHDQPHFGASIAKEMSASYAPSFHTLPGAKSEILGDVRALAASKVASVLPLPKSSLAGMPMELTEEYTTKSFHLGEIVGEVAAASAALDKAEEADLWCVLAERLHGELLEVTNKPLEGGDATPIVETMWRAGACVHYALTTAFLSSTSMGISRSRRDAVHRLLRTLSGAVNIHFSVPVMECIVSIWRWLSASCTTAGLLIMKECAAAFEASAAMGLGVFERDTRASSNQVGGELVAAGSAAAANTADGVETIMTHVCWIEFLEKCLDMDAKACSSIFSSLESISKEIEMILPTHKNSVAVFKLLKLALRVVDVSMTGGSAASGITSDRRRILREVVYKVAFRHFEKPIIFSKKKSVEVLDYARALSDFMKKISRDARLWSVDYSLFSVTGKSPKVVSDPIIGVAAAQTFLGKMIRLSSTAGVGSAFGCYSFMGISSADAHRDMKGVLVQSSAGVISGAFHLLALFALREIDRLASMAGSAKAVNLNLRDVQKRLSGVSAKDSVVAVFPCAWCVAPSLALRLVELYPHWNLMEPPRGRGTLSPAGVMANNYASLSQQSDWRLANVGPTDGLGAIDAIDANALLFWAPAPAHVCLNLLSRTIANNGGVAQESHPVEAGVMRYCVRSLQMLSVDVLVFYLPQLVQLLRRDVDRSLEKLLLDLSSTSALICHQLVWLLQAEQIVSPDADVFERLKSQKKMDKRKASQAHGFCNRLPGTDPLPALALGLLQKVENSLSESMVRFMKNECEFFNKVTSISAELKLHKDKSQHNKIIQRCLESIQLSDGLYLPTCPNRQLVGVEVESGIPMQSAAKCPYLLVFQTVPWAGPDSFLSGDTQAPSNLVSISDAPQTDAVTAASSKTTSRKVSFSNVVDPQAPGADSDDDSEPSEPSLPPTSESTREGSTPSGLASFFGFGANKSSDSNGEGDPNDEADISKDAAKGEEGTDDGDAPVVSAQDVVIDLDKQDDKNLTFTGLRGLRRWSISSKALKYQLLQSPFSSKEVQHDEYPQHEPSDRRDACIFKVYDDCRQDALTIQVVRLLKNAFLEAGLTLHLTSYQVIANRTGVNRAVGGILQVIPNVKSRDQLGKAGTRTLRQYYIAQFGQPGSAPFEDALMAFMSSLAAYGVLCYILGEFILYP